LDPDIIKPHGGELVNLLISHERGVELAAESSTWPVWVLSSAQLVDLESLIIGAYSPLRGFMRRADYESVLNSMHLENGTFWPVPVVLGVNIEFAEKLRPGMEISLCNLEGVMIAVLHAEEIWQPDSRLEKKNTLESGGRRAAEFYRTYTENDRYFIGGPVEGFVQSTRLDFQALRPSPAKNRAFISRMGWDKVIAFPTVRPIHKAVHKFTENAAVKSKANLLIQVLDGDIHPGDKKYYALVRSLEAVLPYYPANLARLVVLRSKLRMLGPREAMLQAIIARNFGCSAFILDPNLYTPPAGESDYSSLNPDDYEKLWMKYKDELAVEMVPFEEFKYVEHLNDFVQKNEIPEGAGSLSLSDDDLIEIFEHDNPVPEWFSFPEVLVELRKAHLPRREQGFTVFFTGLSGAGKSTIASALMVKLLQLNERPVTLLDGDVVRRNLSSELGFSREHRNINIRRIGFVASEITKNKGIAICAPIAPYDVIRREVRQAISRLGGFVLVHVSTPLEECENRDRKGLYAKARAGVIKGFTGISDPYESPEDADLVIDTTTIDPEDAVREIIAYLRNQGYIG
jgi:sulfate adenylyltransferase